MGLMEGNTLILIAIAVFAVLAVVIGFVLRSRSKKPVQLEKPQPKVAPTVVQAPEPELVPVPTPKVEKGLSQKLEKTRGSLSQKLFKFFQSGAALQPKEWDEIEEILLEGDVGIQTTTVLLDRVKAELKKDSTRGLKDLIRTESEGLLGNLQHGGKDLSNIPKPLVISIVGINGVGKTTTIGKLAQKFKSEGKEVLLGAADTFRAGAITQLKIWSERVGTQFVTGREGADPGAVAFDSLTAAKARGVDIVLLDTAGRLHTKSNLMDELKKIDRVMKKVIPDAPHETWLVVDGTLGQNSVQQAREFQKTLELTGIIVTKLDGTAKGGAVIAIASELKLPIKYIGVGEAVEDLVPFSPKPFIDAILG